MVAVRLGRLGRINDYTHWEKISADDIALWERAKEVISCWQYVSKGVVITVECDFSPIVEAHEENVRWHHAVLSDSPVASSISESMAEFSSQLFIKVTIEDERGVAENKSRYEFYAEKFLYDVFFVMNMSRPGVCDFLSVRIDSGLGVVTKLKLSGDCFESSFYKILKGKSFAPRVISLDVMAAWYRKLDLGVSQIAGLRVENAIYSILHICRGSDVDIVWVIWAFHALEAIYGTKVGEGFTNLIDRVSGLLELDNQDKKHLRKSLREMYDYRSSFVHGGYKVHHPMMNEIMDDRLNGECAKLLDVMQFGFDLIVMSLQALAVKGWYGIKVEEKILGVLPSDIS